ncbi:MAG: nucleoside recognition domain-containing protein, partial [Coprobacillus sp.]
TIIPAVCLAVGFLDVVEEYGAFKAAEKLFNPILKPLIGVPGSAGIAFVSSFTSSDVGAIMTKELYDTGQISDDERSIFAVYQYSASAVILNTINTQAPLLPIVLFPVGGVIGILFVMKIIGANLVRLYIKVTSKKGVA